MTERSADDAGTVVVSYRAPLEHLERLRRIAPGCRVVQVADVAEARAAVPEASAFLGNPFFLQSLPHAGKLRWMQSNSAGADLILGDPLARSHPFVLTLTRGIYDDEMADHALALLYALLRRLPAAWRAAAEGRWQRQSLPHLAGRTAFVFGAGGVGQAVARRLSAARARVSLVRRMPSRETELGFPSLDIRTALDNLADAEVVVLALPLTPETRGAFGRGAFARLRDGAYLVNVSRGALIDDAALREHVDRLGGVGLDVFAEEPLPPEHWLWRHPAVMVTPHVARSPDPGAPPWLELFEANLAAFVAGRPLLHVADKERGY